MGNTCTSGKKRKSKVVKADVSAWPSSASDVASQPTAKQIDDLEQEGGKSTVVVEKPLEKSDSNPPESEDTPDNALKQDTNKSSSGNKEDGISAENSKKISEDKRNSQDAHTDATQSLADGQEETEVTPVNKKTPSVPGGKHAVSEEKSANVMNDLEEKDIHTKASFLKPEASDFPKSNEGFRLIAAQQKGELGIQGFRYSCYMDSTLTSLFQYDTDSTFLHYVKSKKGLDGERENVRDILCDEIGSPLSSDRGRLMMNHSTMTDFRTALATFDRSYLRDTKDPEEFLEFLFRDIFALSPFYTTQDGSGSFVYQIHGDPNLIDSKATSVQKLLDLSFSNSGTTLVKTPYPGLILKIPVADGKPLYPYIFPELVINLEKILGVTSLKNESKMRLGAILCLRNKRYTTFIRTNKKDTMSPWIYLDSYEHSENHYIDNLDEFLSNPSPNYDKSDTLLNLLLGYIYLCIYLPIS